MRKSLSRTSFARGAPGVSLSVDVDQTSADTWHLPGEVMLSGHVDNVFEPEAAQVRVQLSSGAPVTAELSTLEQDQLGSTRMKWVLRLWLEDPGVGSIAVTVLANVGRQSAAVRRTFAVAQGENGPVGELLSPAPGAALSGDILIVQGWCLFPKSRTSRVAVFVDGQMVDLARIYTEQASEVPVHPDSALCGFECVLNLRRQERTDTTEVSVEATSLDWRRWRSPVHVVTWAERPWDWEEAAELHYVSARNTKVVGSIPTDRSTVVVFTHDLGFAGAQLWLTDLLRSVVSGRSSRCTIVSLNDGPLRSVLEGIGIEVHITTRPMLGSARSLKGMCTSWRSSSVPTAPASCL